MEQIGYLGPEGSYSHLAANLFRPNAEKKAYSSFELVVQALTNGDCTVVVLPIENSLNGGVNKNIDLLQNTPDIFAFEERTIEIDHRLAVLTGANTDNINRIYSHQQALAQCGEYLYRHFPEAELLAVPSTAAGLEMLKSFSDACIVGSHISKRGVTLSSENIADEKLNLTHFLLVKKGNAEKTASDKIYFSATCRHKPGALLNVLQVIKDGGLNMTKIQSRPIKEKPGEYRFFIEIEGNYMSAEVQKILERLRESAGAIKILGVY